MKTVNDLIKELSCLSEDTKDKPIKVICPNGLRVYPDIKKKRQSDYDFSSEIEEIVLTW